MGLLSRLGKKLKVLGGQPPPPQPRDLSKSASQPVYEEPEPQSPRPKDVPVRDFLEQTVKAHAIVLFMKGTPQAPRCGFSANAASMLASSGKPFHTVDVLSDEEIRDGIKEYSSWPTLPQIYIGGEFVGGSDIVAQLHASGELQQLIEKATAGAA